MPNTMSQFVMVLDIFLIQRGYRMD